MTIPRGPGTHLFSFDAFLFRKSRPEEEEGGEEVEQESGQQCEVYGEAERQEDEEEEEASCGEQQHQHEQYRSR